MTIPQIDTQYATGVSRRGIEQALIAAGKDLGHLAPADLWLLEDFHTMGRIATTQLVDLCGITNESDVLDAGTGIGGTARFVADRCHCRVTAVDLTEEYCETAGWLNRLVGLDDWITVRQADVTDLPFAGADFRRRLQPACSDERGRQGQSLPGSAPGTQAGRPTGDVGHHLWRTRRTRVPASMGRPTRTQPPGDGRRVACCSRVLGFRD